MDKRLQIVFSRRNIRTYTGHPAEEKEPRTRYDLAQVHHNKW